jgi:peroxiredoxin
MVITLCLLTCAVAAPQQPAGTAQWQIVPRLSAGEELVYTGTHTEKSAGRSVHFQRTQHLEHRVFVLDATPQGLEMGLLTLVKDQRPRTANDNESTVSIRLERARVSPRGRVTAEGAASFRVPLEGAAPVETGAFVELVSPQLRPNDTWEMLEDGRPARTWKMAGMEAVNGTTCIKLIGTQQSDEWSEPRADRPAWRRTDTVWLAPNLGVALRFERIIEHREPGRRDTSLQSATAYALEHRMVYSGQLAESRRREILLAHRLGEKTKPALKNPEKAEGKFFEETLARIAQHNHQHPVTPYRQALDQLQRRLEAARRGEAIPVGHTEEAAGPAPVIALGQPAPDFVATDLSKRETARLHKLLGRPVLMVFYNPKSRHASDLLKFAQSIRETRDATVTVLAFTVTDDTEAVLKQREDLGLTFPILSGQGLKFTYAVEATPKVVVLDARGVVRGAYVGWGSELPDLVSAELARWKTGSEVRSPGPDGKEK